MNNNHDSKFSTGFLLGLIIGGGAIFLLGTRTGKNLLKIISEQGLDGLLNLLEEYNLGDLGEYEEVETEEDADLSEHQSGEESKEKNETSEKEKKEHPPKRFFKRIRR